LQIHLIQQRMMPESEGCFFKIEERHSNSACSLKRPRFCHQKRGGAKEFSNSPRNNGIGYSETRRALKKFCQPMLSLNGRIEA
jgi:hypothetical protein